MKRINVTAALDAAAAAGAALEREVAAHEERKARRADEIAAQERRTQEAKAEANRLWERRREEWPDRTCTCGKTWKNPHGGEGECDDCRRSREADERRAVACFAKEQERRRLSGIRDNLPEFMSRAGIPAGYHRYTRESWEALYGAWEDRESTRELIGWPWQDLHPCDWAVVLYGPYGRRKTSLATSVLVEALCRGLDVQFWDMNDYLERLKLGIRKEKAEQAQLQHGWQMSFELVDAVPYTILKNRVLDVPVLLLDDLGSIRGARSGEGWWREEITFLLRQRHAWNRATIVTTNGEIESLRVIDPSLVSRLDVRLAWEMDDGTDYRRVEAHTSPIAADRFQTLEEEAR